MSEMINENKEVLKESAESTTEVLHLQLEMVRLNEQSSFDYHADINNRQIVFTPDDSSVSFVNIELLQNENPSVDVIDRNTRRFSISVTANMLSEDENFDYTCDIDDIGQAIVTPSSEHTTFDTFTIKGTTEIVEDSEDMDTAYSYKELEQELKLLTNNFTKESDTLKCGFDEEKDMSREILKQHYGSVGVFKSGGWWYIEYKDLLTEAIDSSDKQFEVKRETVELVINDFEELVNKLLDKAIRIQKDFQTIGIEMDDELRDLCNDIESYIDDNSDMNVQKLRNALQSYAEGKPLEEDVEGATSETAPIVDRFMRSDITIIQTNSVPVGESIIELPELRHIDAKGVVYRYFYDKDSDTVGYYEEKETESNV